jgi:hypothetical protein
MDHNRDLSGEGAMIAAVGLTKGLPARSRWRAFSRGELVGMARGICKDRWLIDEHHPDSCGLGGGIGEAIWNNKGDCGHLFDPIGALVSQYCY